MPKIQPPELKKFMDKKLSGTFVISMLLYRQKLVDKGHRPELPGRPD